MRAIFNSIRNVAATDAAALIQGESVTGKEMVAVAIHKESYRRDRPFVPFNCGAMPEGMVEIAFLANRKNRQMSFKKPVDNACWLLALI